MKAFNKHSGKVVPINRSNIDTDIIIPKEFLKRIERSGFGQYLMYDWRFDKEGNPRPDFALNQNQYKDATILLTRENFGSGSSRENAVWALQDYGFQAIIAPSFADIFKINSSKTGLLLIELDPETIDLLFNKVQNENQYTLHIDLEKEVLVDEIGWKQSFSIDPYTRTKLLNGWDDISFTLKAEESISSFEQQRPAYMNPS